MTDVIETPVLIVGGGPIGLALALDLGLRGVTSVVIERAKGPETEIVSKAGTLNERTLEICRTWGIRDEVASYYPDDFPQDNVYCTALNGKLVGHDPRAGAAGRIPPDTTPEIFRKCPQMFFDPLLARAALRTGKVTIRYSSRFDRFAEDADGVTAHIEDLLTGQMVEARSKYLVACDGAASRIRRALGIAFPGEDLGPSVSALVTINHIERHIKLPLANRYMFIGLNGIWANLTAVDGHDVWRFIAIGVKDETDMNGAEGQIRRAFGPHVPFELVKLMPWKRSACLAESYRKGRVLLAGDAAHTTSPTGGHGLNTGLGDVFTLGWMLTAVLEGWGSERLLDIYGRERRPVAIYNTEISTVNFNNWLGGADWSLVHDDGPQADRAREQMSDKLKAALEQEWSSHGVGLGYRYEGSPLIVPDGTPPTPYDPMLYVPTARPGHLAPHGWLPDGRPIVDLFGKRFVLLRFGSSPPDAAPLVAAARARRVPLEIVDLDLPQIAKLYERRLVLVRPDGIVAWRGDELPRDVGALVDTVRGAVSD